MNGLRRYTPIKSSRGTVIPLAVRREVYAADEGCVGPRIGMPGACEGPPSLDHIRASGAIGRKSESVRGNLATLCLWKHHPLKTEYGRIWRPRLLAYVEKRDAGVNDRAVA